MIWFWIVMLVLNGLLFAATSAMFARRLDLDWRDLFLVFTFFINGFVVGESFVILGAGLDARQVKDVAPPAEMIDDFPQELRVFPSLELVGETR